jgi:hypothetical protein
MNHNLSMMVAHIQDEQNFIIGIKFHITRHELQNRK